MLYGLLGEKRHQCSSLVLDFACDNTDLLGSGRMWQNDYHREEFMLTASTWRKVEPMSWEVMRLRTEPSIIALSIGHVVNIPSNSLSLNAGGGRGREEAMQPLKDGKVCERECTT